MIKVYALLLVLALPYVQKDPIEYTKVEKIVFIEHKSINVSAFKGVVTTVTRRIELYEANLFQQLVKTKTINLNKDEFPEIWKIGLYYQFRYCERNGYDYYEDGEYYGVEPDIIVHRYKARTIRAHMTETDKSWPRKKLN